MIYKLKYGLISFTKKFGVKIANEIIKKCDIERKKLFTPGNFASLILPFFHFLISDKRDLEDGYKIYIYILKYKLNFKSFLKQNKISDKELYCFYKSFKKILLENKEKYLIEVKKKPIKKVKEKKDNEVIIPMRNNFQTILFILGLIYLLKKRR